MVKVVKWDLRILWAVHSRHRRTKYSYNTRVCTHHPENEAQRTSGSTNPPKLAMTWMTWHRQKATTVRTNGVLNNWYIYIYIYILIWWFNENYGLFFFCIPLRESSIDERSPVNSWGTMRRANSRIRWNCVRMLLVDCTTRTPRTSNWPTTDWNQRNQFSKPTHFRKVFGSPVECHFNCMQSVVLLDCQDLSNPNQRKHAQ